MKKSVSLLFCLAMALICQTSNAQNMTQKDAIDNLNGTWYLQTNNWSNPTITLFNSWSPNQRSASVTGFASKQYDYWSIHTNTLNFVSGTIQATNKNPFLNDNYKYRSLTRTTCEFFINNQWIPASKNGGQTQQPTGNNNAVRPTENNNNNNTQRPTVNNTTRPNENNNNGQQQGTNVTGQKWDNSQQLEFPPDKPGTLAPTNNNNNTTSPTGNNTVVRPVVDGNNTQRPTNGYTIVRTTYDNTEIPVVAPNKSDIIILDNTNRVTVPHHNVTNGNNGNVEVTPANGNSNVRSNTNTRNVNITPNRNRNRGSRNR